jgi:HEAT repeat protein
MKPASAESSTPGGERAASVEAFLGTLDKVVRGIRLYEGHGDLLERLYVELEKKLRLATEVGDVTLRVASFGLLHHGTLVTPENKRLPYLFRLFCDGLRELTITHGASLADVKALTEVLAQDPRAGEDDLVTLLWKRDLRGVEVYAVDALTTGAEIGPDGQLVLGRHGAKARLARASTEGALALALSSDDVRAIHPDDALAWVHVASRFRGEPATVGAYALDVADEPHARELARFVEIALARAARDDGGPSPLLAGAWESALAQQDTETAMTLVETLARVAEHDLAPPADSAPRRVWRALATPAAMRALAPWYPRHAARLAASLATLAAGGGPELVALLLALPPGEASAAIEDLLRGLGVDLTPMYRTRLASADEAVLLDAIAALGRIGTDEAADALCEILRHNRTQVRAAVLAAMKNCPPERIRTAVGRTLRDMDHENRLASLRLLTVSRDPRAAGFVLSAVRDREFATRETGEQETFLRALSSFRDGRTAAFFRDLLDEVHLTRSRAISARQLLAVQALVEIGNPEAEEALRVQLKKWHLPREVKDAIRVALRDVDARS